MRHPLRPWLAPAALATLALIAAPAARAAETAKKPFTIQDLYRLKGVGEPALSPDGRTIVFTVSTTDLPAAKKTTNLWRVDADGTNLSRLTFTQGADTHPRFSPDGKTIGFLSTRSGDPQLHLLPLGGGEAERKTDFPGGVGSFFFSPDGKRVALVAEVHPSCGADADCNRKADEAREKGKMKAHLSDRLPVRHWNAWRDDKRSHLLLLDLAEEGGSLRDLTPGDADVPAFALGGEAEVAFSPDGKALVFSSNRDEALAASTNSDLFEVPVDAPDASLASPRRLTGANRAWDGSPAFSPDGRFLAYRSQKTPGFEADLFRISLLDRTAGTTHTLTSGFDDTIRDLAFSADGKKLYFTAEMRGRTPLHEIDLATGKLRVLTSDGTLDAWHVSRDGTFAVVARRRIGSPSELWRVDLTGKAKEPEVRLTRFNEPVEKEVDIRGAEEIWVDGAAGKKVQVWVVKPHGFDPAKKYPLILNVHGGPQQQWADAFRGDWQVYPGAGYVVAFPNPHGSTGFGSEYTAAISGDWDGNVMTDIRKVTDALAALPYVDAGRMGAMGWSWGGYAMMWLEGHTDRYKALAAMMGVYDLRTMHSATEELWFPQWDLKGTPWDNPGGYQKQSPSSFVTGFKTPCLVITGQRDYRVPYTQSLAFFTDLQLKKVPSRLVVYENAGHWPSWYEMALYYAAHLDWFHTYLGGGPSTLDPEALVRGTAFEKKDEAAPETAKK